jgi:predicted acylesterase/phospholipase RssA
MPDRPSVDKGSIRSSLEKKRREDMAQAESVLRGEDLTAQEAYNLAERLKNQNEFGYARRLYRRIRMTNDYSGLKPTPARVGQRHALCTYKDPDLPAGDRFQRALEILDEVDRLWLTDNEKQESLGLRGAVYKRRWQVNGQRADLDRSLGCYLKGREIGSEKDQGYTGINAAFVLDLMAREDARQASETGVSRSVAIDLWCQANQIRRDLVTLLRDLSQTPDLSWLKKEWWFYATRAEVHLGLGEFPEALDVIQEYNAANDIPHQQPPLEQISPWELESTITQFASLIQLQADLGGLLGDLREWKERCFTPLDELRARGRRMLQDYLGDLAPGVDRAMAGKVGLGLSGGGFRASLFHIGVLAYLAEQDLLRHVEVLSCVSGGSIVGAHYYLEVKRLLESKSDAEITRQDYVDLVKTIEREFLAGVQTNIRCRLFGSVRANLRAFLQPGFTTTRRLGELYEKEIYARVPDGKGKKPRYLRDLFVEPQGAGPNFKPKYDNWLRANKVPVLVLNAATLNTGHLWQFTASWMGEPPISLDAEIEGNYRLRRMYHDEAPRLKDQWRGRFLRLFAPPDYRHLRLGEAVAASSCVPGVFEPLVLPDLYEGKTVRLVDGGVYDNQGVASLLEQDCSLMIVSDASGQMDNQDHPSGSRLGVPLRSFSISMARVRQSQYRELDARRRSGLLKGLMFLHLKKDLDADRIDWRECQDPDEASDEARPAARRGVLTRYGIQKSIQRLLSAIRTDLDSFTEVEAFALMTSGYCQAQAELGRCAGFPAAKPTTSGAESWRFLQIEPALNPGPGFDTLTRQLKVGSMVAGKVWRLCRSLTVIAGLLLVPAVYLGYRLWDAYGGVTLLTVHTLGVCLMSIAAAVLFPHLVRLVRFKQTFGELGLRSVLAVVLAFGFKIHLLFFDSIFIRLGKVEPFLRLRRQDEVSKPPQQEQDEK